MISHRHDHRISILQKNTNVNDLFSDTALRAQEKSTYAGGTIPANRDNVTALSKNSLLQGPLDLLSNGKFGQARIPCGLAGFLLTQGQNMLSKHSVQCWERMDLDD